MRPSLTALLIVLLLSPSAFGAVPIRLDIRPDGASLAKGDGEAEPKVSADGRFATFGPWIRDLTTGAVERYAFDVDGTPVLTHSASEGDVMSEDGRYVVFLDEIYDDPRLLVRDRALQTTVALPITTDGQPIASFVFNPQISRDGRVVTFHARSSNLPGGVSSTQAYLHDVASGVTELVSIPAPGGTAGGEASWPSPSHDGRYVVFRSQATDMGWGMIGPQMYVRDRVAGTTALVSRSSGGAPSLGSLRGVAQISTDGRWITFESRATNLDPACTGGASAVFLHDRIAGTTECVSLSTSGVQADTDATSVAVSPDGTRVLFSAPEATNLDAGDPRSADLYVRNRLAGTTTTLLRMPTVGLYPQSVSAAWDKVVMSAAFFDDPRIPAAGAAFLVDLADDPPCTGGVAIARAKVTMTKLTGPVGEQQVKISGELAMPPGTFDPAGRGLQLSLAEPGNGEMRFWDFTARTLPVAPAGVVAGCAPGDGWKTSSVTHQYRNKSGALLANECVPGTARGLSQIKLKDLRAKRGVVAFSAKARKADLPLIRAGLRVTLVLGADAAAGAAGECGTHVFSPGQCVPSRGNSAVRCSS